MPKVALFTPELKTFFYLLYDNRRECWIECGKWLANNPGKEMKDIENKPSTAAIKAAKEANTPLNVKMWEAKYTDNTLGKVNCGWSPQAFIERDAILGVIKSAHNQHWDRIVKLEKDFLPKLQEKENIELDKASKKQKVCPLANVVVNDFSEDEDDFADVVQQENV